MAKYLRSTSTGVVLPYNAKLAMRPNVVALTDEEAAEYLAGVKNPTAVVPTPEPTPEPEPVPEPVPEPEAEAPVFEQALDVAVSDISDGEPNAEELLAALEID